ncbi:hypothetical protein Patl1_32898 [Pistacia atlantica]|uniref:Uncharacterized protein n=1 Tax=Pistacia atlantica TaxID=434234 RepID=A0ACC1ANR9_9ROSI|nr:hypothetical protein Patl1_32898 [Pistacia atlantica]
MIFRAQNSIFSLAKQFSSQTLLKPSSKWLYQSRFITKVRLKWVKNRGLDHIIDIDTDLKAACLLKDAIKRSSTGFLTAKSVSEWQKLLGLTVPVVRFLRRYPTLFEEFPHSRYANLPCFRLTDTAQLLDSQEQSIHQTYEKDTMERLCRMLMMMKSRTMPLQSLHSLKWDLGLPDNFEKILIPKYPDDFLFVKTSNGLAGLRLAQWHEEFAISALQKRNEIKEIGNDYRQFKRGQTALAFPMNFPRGYGAQKKTKRNYLRSLREELSLPQKFTRLFTRYPGIFYLSLKCKTTTVALKEGYQRGSVVDPHPLVRIRKKFYHVMKTGLLYRCKGVNILPQEDILLDDNVESETEQEETEEEEIGSGDDCYEETSELEDESDEEP